MERQTAALTHRMHLAKRNVPLYLRDKRANKDQRWRRRQLKSLAHARQSSLAISAAFGRRSLIVRMVAGIAPPPTKPTKIKRRVGFTLPTGFSLMEAPEQALASLSHLARAMAYEGLNDVYIDFSRLTQYDLGANALLDVLVDELDTQARRSKRVIRWRGNFPTDPAHVRFVRALGVIKRLKVEHEYLSKVDEHRLLLFDERCKHYVRAVRPREADRKTKVTVRFADHINKCLKTIGRAMTPAARGRLCNYVGEILDNVEEHSGMFDWSIQGYLDTQLATPMCEITIFNFGASITETFERLPEGHWTREQIQTYMDLHTKKRLFGTTWRKEDLYTLLSLQGGVSTKNDSADSTRGNGSGDLIDFFQRVHSECSNGESAQARMIILSGSTYITFDGKYKLVTSDTGLRTIAFNEKNDLRERPDPTYVRQLAGVSFPGTLISVKFPLSTAKSTQATGAGDET